MRACMRLRLSVCAVDEDVMVRCDADAPVVVDVVVGVGCVRGRGCGRWRGCGDG